MTQFSARDLMTSEVVTVPPTTPVFAIARLLAERGISAVPVLDAAAKLVGIVTEADLLRRLAGEADHKGSWLSNLFTNAERDAARYARAHGATAADLMTTDIVSVAPTTSAAEVAHLMEERSVRRLLVVQDGRLLGIVSRADLLRALVAPTHEALDLSDDRIRSAVLAEIRKQPWADTFYTLIDVKNGVAEINGFSRSTEVQRALRVLVENVPGVKSVEDRTTPMPAQMYAAG